MADQRDLILSPVQFAFVQDGSNSGNVKVYVGPKVEPISGNDRLVLWSGRKFYEPADQTEAKQTFKTATENQYVVLENPVAGSHESHPEKGSVTAMADLDFGKTINIPGPVTFALWPGQGGEVIDGHRLSFNEYLVVQCINPVAANGSEPVEAPAEPTGDDAANKRARKEVDRPWTRGEQRVIKGTVKSFYIPPTGVEVLKEEKSDGKLGSYVRKAAVVRQLEYVCLIDEQGRQRYVEGPAVVFPEPDETFKTEKGERIFRKMDLSGQTGLHIKVTEDYKHDTARPLQVWRGDEMVEVKEGEQLREGDELFLTGKDTPIYMPRKEQAVIELGENRKKHPAVEIPAGDGRYVVDLVGDGGVGKIEGPKMFLADPRTQRLVRRVLDQRTVALWYPDNEEARTVNAALMAAKTARGGEYLMAEPQFASLNVSAAQAGSLSKSYPVTGGMAADRIKRTPDPSPSRAIELGGKYEGPPKVSVYPGYAVMVMDPTGRRRVEVGPVDLQLEYHETLMALTLSTGRPKGSNPPIRTVYLRTINTAVGDRVLVETRDLVPVSLEVSLRVNFEGETPEERARWFYIEDYVALLTDNVRSRLRNLAKRHNIQEFYENTIDLVRDELLLVGEGEGKRPGREFPENGMRLHDVEVLAVEIADPNVRAMLDQATAASLRGAIEVSQAQEATKREGMLEGLKRTRLTAHEETAVVESAATIAGIKRDLERSLEAISQALQEVEGEAKVNAARRVDVEEAEKLDIAMARARNVMVMERVADEVDQFVRRTNAVDPKLVEAVRVFGQERLVREITEAMAPVAIAAGVPAVEIARQHFRGTAVEPVLAALAAHPFADALTNGGGTE